uniref:CUE domain-containing protein n=1 Tax=Oryza brachyantha TaxID=4533 RepID=J3M6W1_ORYBR
MWSSLSSSSRRQPLSARPPYSIAGSSSSDEVTSPPSRSSSFYSSSSRYLLWAIWFNLVIGLAIVTCRLRALLLLLQGGVTTGDDMLDALVEVFPQLNFLTLVEVCMEYKDTIDGAADYIIHTVLPSIQDDNNANANNDS